jgi:uncharacterized phage protein gp47/JayE
MAWQIPSLSDLAERTRTAFQTYLPATNANVWPSATAVSAKVIAARVWELFHRQDYLARQAFPLTAEGEYLDRHAQVYGLARKTSIKAFGQINLTGGDHRTLIPSGTQFQRASGEIYISQGDAYITYDGTLNLDIEAQVAGASGNVGGGETLTMLAAIAGAPATAVTTARGIYGGGAMEGDKSLRARLLDVIRTPPNAGSEADYRRWSMQVPGVTRVWVEGGGFGPGTVAVYFMMDDVYADGLPLAADVANLQAHLDGLKPITARVVVSAPTPHPIFVEVEGLTPSTPEVIDNIVAELTEVVAIKGEVSTRASVKHFRRSWIWQAISNATGEQYHSVSLPAVDEEIPVGSVPVFDETYLSSR